MSHDTISARAWARYLAGEIFVWAFRAEWRASQ